ncbi:zinc finger protein 667-like [Pseudomyrmex gracilis]|uniref:zinc finger protein 667-like n=1 Tax=Pseudomyrmex gracilis TaxID=219809 RepID=UPI0009956751|nr:zinc finger protein 667-like [Pseudomyrmex gracilis]
MVAGLRSYESCINSGFDYFKSFTHYSSPIFPVPVSTDFIISNESARSNAQAKVVCSKCDKTFACEYSRNRHINDNICGKIGNLEYKFACKFCKKRYKLKGSLTRHQNQDHKKNKPKFKCPFDCDKSFGYPFILNRHIENIHKKKMKSNADPQTKKTKQGKKTKKTTETYPNQQLPFESVSRCSSRSTSLSDKQRATVHKTDYTDGNGIVSTTSTLYSKYIPIPIYDRLNPPKEKSETADYNKWLSLTGDTTIISYKQYPKLTDGSDLTVQQDEEFLDSGKSYLCPKCGKTYAKMSVLKRHLNTVCEKPFMLYCNACGYKTPRKDVLNRHVLNRHVRHVHSS